MDVSLIDTPGFNDPGTSDIDVLEALVSFLADDTYHVIGVVYLHAITDKKITGTTRLSLRLLREICGEHFYQNIVLATSMWDSVPHESLHSTIDRESLLSASKDFWGDMMPKGSRYIRWSEIPGNDCKTALQIVQMCSIRTEAPKLKVFIELQQVQKQAALEETSAGRLATERIRMQQEQTERALVEELQAAQEEKKQLEEARTRAARQLEAQYHDGRNDALVRDMQRGGSRTPRTQSWNGHRQGRHAHSSGRSNGHSSHQRESDRQGHGHGGSIAFWGYMFR